MKGIKCCAECADYSLKKHKCTCGAKDPGKASDSFYADCPLDDAELVRHGRWIVNVRNPDYVDCTNCGLSEWIGANGSRAYAETLLSGFKKYCPNCGARMDATDTNVCGKGGEQE